MPALPIFDVLPRSLPGFPLCTAGSFSDIQSPVRAFFIIIIRRNCEHMIIKSIIADQLYSVSSILEKICYVSFIGICNQTECPFFRLYKRRLHFPGCRCKASYVPFLLYPHLCTAGSLRNKNGVPLFPVPEQLQNPFSQHKAYGLQERITAITSPFLTNAYQYLC